MSYTRVNWQNSPNTSTPLSAENLNKMDAGIKRNADDIETLQQHTYDTELNSTSTNAPQTKTVYEELQRINIETDPTLTVSGKAADAAATGEAVANVKSAIVNYNSYDVLADVTRESRELYGVTWTWDATNTVCTAVGTATQRSRSRFFASNDAIPDWIKPGKTYHIKIQSTGTAPAFYLAYYQNGSMTYERNYRTDAVITIPSDITGFIAVLQVATGYSVNGTISVQMLQGESNEALYDDFMTVDGIANANAKMRSFGNSILTGSVWQNGSGVGLVDYDNAPYGQIAKALNIPKNNVSHTLISSTGLIYDAGSGSFLDNIKNTNLSGYDYLLTMFWTTDLEHTYSLGTIDDTASDQTLAGAVVDLITYMHTSNGNCQLILVSVPPVSYTHAGDNVFTDLYANGFSIHDLDVLMRQMAHKYHFIFLDWEQMALSYYYQNYTDGDNVHANNAVTYRVMGEYLGRCLRYQQDIPKNKELKYNSYNILDYVGQYKSRSSYGVTFTWNPEHTECTANGTADGGRAYVNIYNKSSAMPDGINPGSKYNVLFTTTDVKFALVFGLYDTLGSYIEDKVFRSDGVLEIPDGCGGMYIRLFVDNGRSVTNAVASNIALLNADTNYQLSQDVEQMAQQIYGIKTGYDVLTRYGNFTDRTFRGITFTWSGRQCHVSGTADGGEAFVNIYYGSLPDGMSPGDLYSIRYESTTSRIGVHCYFYDESETLISNVSGSSDMGMMVPFGASKWLIRIYVLNGATLDGYLTRLQVVKVKPLEMDVPLIVSFVDDDTTTDELVTKFHDACCHNGVKGNYAVITNSVENGNTSASRLVAYEDEGFGLLIHCYQQYYPSDSPWNPEGGVRTEAQTNACRANLAKGIRQMIDMGLLNYDYWITPGGHREQDLIDIAKQLSLKCLISTNNGRENNMTDYNKWFIKRVSFGATDTPASSSMSGIKALIDEVASRGKGWFIITTHFNDGWSDLTWDDTLDANGYPIGYARFNEMVQYAISKGMVPMSIPQAWQYYAPILEANRNECNQANAT